MKAEHVVKPYIKASIDGKSVKTLGFECLSVKYIPIPKAKILLENTVSVSIGNKAEISLCYGSEEEWIVFTGYVEYFYSAHVKIVYLSGGNKEAASKNITENYRSEKAKNILSDCLSACGVSDYKLTVPDVEIDRFVASGSLQEICNSIIETLYLYGVSDELHFFFDQKNIFRFGTIENTGVHEEKIFDMDKGIIYKNLYDGIETIPLPVKHSQKIRCNNEEKMTTRTSVLVYPKTSCMEIYW